MGDPSARVELCSRCFDWGEWNAVFLGRNDETKIHSGQETLHTRTLEFLEFPPGSIKNLSIYHMHTHTHTHTTCNQHRDNMTHPLYFSSDCYTDIDSNTTTSETLWAQIHSQRGDEMLNIVMKSKAKTNLHFHSFNITTSFYFSFWGCLVILIWYKWDKAAQHTKNTLNVQGS